MADKFEKLVRCQHCQGFLPYVRGQQQLSGIDLLDCKRHIPSKLVVSETYQNDRLTPKRAPFSGPNRSLRAAALYVPVAPSRWSHATWVIRRHHKRFTVAAGSSGDHVFTPHCRSVHTSGRRVMAAPRYPLVPTSAEPGRGRGELPRHQRREPAK